MSVDMEQFELVHVTGLRYLGGYRLWLRFSDGAEGEIDLEEELWGEVFEPLKDPTFFAQARLDLDTVTWPNGADLAPEFLRANIQPVVEPHADAVAGAPPSDVG